VYDLLVPSPVGQIPLTQLGEIEVTQAESEIRRKDKRRMIVVSANIARGDLSGKVAEIRRAIADWKLEPGFAVHFGGAAERQAEEFGYIFEALALAIVLTYMVLCGILESYVHPLTIMLTLPLGLVGTALGLFLSGVTINIISLMAVVMLVGIVVNNAILILDYAAQLRTQGQPMRQALLDASVTRLRPIVMTNLAIALAIAPQALGGSGSEFRQAVAVVTMGGVLVSAVFTLYLIPAIYTAFDRLTVAGRRERRAQGSTQQHLKETRPA
jgi:HAE1 family hydrophobic/amphiphilic exporter-1